MGAGSAAAGALTFTGDYDLFHGAARDLKCSQPYATVLTGD